MKALTLIIFCMGLTLPLTAQTLTLSEKGSEVDFGLDLTASYTGREVQMMLEALTEEADVAIKEAYLSGYRAAELKFRPQIAYWQSIANSRQIDLNMASAETTGQSWDYAWAGFGIGNIVGFGVALAASWVWSQMVVR